MENIINGWFQKHFGNVTPGTELHAQLDFAKRDLKSLLAPKLETPPESPLETTSQE